LRVRDEELRRKDHIIAGLTDVLNRRVVELPASASEGDGREVVRAGRQRSWWRIWEWVWAPPC
jgi:hypothetical protein